MSAGDEYKKKLTPEQFSVCFLKGTEAPFTGKYWDCKDAGIYHCVACDRALFSSDTKYDSGSGWPSYFAPIAKENVELKSDRTHGMERIEVLCRGCGAHLGHVFDDGPPPTGVRYCINSAALRLEKRS